MTVRAHPRYATAVLVTLVTRAGELGGRTTNISAGGLCAEVSGRAALGEDITVRVSLVFPDDNRSEAIEIPSRTVWCTAIDSQFQVGIQFTRMGAQESHDLALFLRLLAHGSQAP